MSYSAREIRKKTQLVRTGFETISVVLDGVTYSSDTVELACPASKVSVQADGNLVFSWSVSCNGQTFVSAGTSIAAGAISTYSTSVVGSVQVTYVSGSGQVSILAVS